QGDPCDGREYAIGTRSSLGERPVQKHKRRPPRIRDGLLIPMPRSWDFRFFAFPPEEDDGLGSPSVAQPGTPERSPGRYCHVKAGAARRGGPRRACPTMVAKRRPG